MMGKELLMEVQTVSDSLETNCMLTQLIKELINCDRPNLEDVKSKTAFKVFL